MTELEKESIRRWPDPTPQEVEDVADQYDLCASIRELRQAFVDGACWERERATKGAR